MTTALALFDFDGTITTDFSMPIFLRRSASPLRLVAGSLLFMPMLYASKVGLVSSANLRSALVRFAFRGYPLDRLERLGQAFARDCLPGLLRPQAMQRIAWHKAQGHRVVVVSGALDVYLRPWCEQHGLEWLCSSLRHENGRCTGHYAGAQCVKEAKVEAVRRLCNLADYDSIYAYGDTDEDEAMLAMAHRSWYRWQERPACVS